MKISPQGTEITKRFFEALETLRKEKKIRGIQTFTNANGINRRNLITVRNNPESSVLKPEWIQYLCEQYGVSAEWMILGKGTMFNQKQVAQAETTQPR